MANKNIKLTKMCVATYVCDLGWLIWHICNLSGIGFASIFTSLWFLISKVKKKNKKLIKIRIGIILIPFVRIHHDEQFGWSGIAKKKEFM